MNSSTTVQSRPKTAVKRTVSSPKRSSYMDPTLSKMNLYAEKGTIEPALTFVKKNRPKSAVKGVPKKDAFDEDEVITSLPVSATTKEMLTSY